MKWMLVVVVLGIAPVKTGLLYDDLDACWTARGSIAREYADVANAGLAWANENLKGERRQATVDLVTSRLTGHAITCIPHVAP